MQGGLGTLCVMPNVQASNKRCCAFGSGPHCSICQSYDQFVFDSNHYLAPIYWSWSEKNELVVGEIGTAVGLMVPGQAYKTVHTHRGKPTDTPQLHVTAVHANFGMRKTSTSYLSILALENPARANKPNPYLPSMPV